MRAVETRVSTDEFDRPQISVSYVLSEREKELVTLTWQVMTETSLPREEAAQIVLAAEPKMDDAFVVYLMGGSFTAVSEEGEYSG